MTHALARFTCTSVCLALAAAATEPVFLARSDYPQISIGCVAVADVNGDGIPDVIGLTGSANVLLGSGKGNFRPGPSSPLGFYANYAQPVAVPLIVNGPVDIVTAGQQSIDGPHGVGVAFGNGDGTFQTAAFYQTGADTFPGNALLGDFNGDGIPDIAVAASSGLWLFIGKGGGLFNSGVLTPFSGTDNVSNQTVAADFNRDGKLDLAITTTTGFVVLLGNGDGTFQPPQSVTAPFHGLYITAGDLNHDGYPDIVLESDYTYVYLNNGKGGFSGPATIAIPAVEQIAIGDVNGDHIPDLVGSVGYIALGNGDGTFQTPSYYPLPSGITVSAVVLADLRHNGRNDLVFQDSDSELSVLLNFGKGKFNDGEWIPVTGGAGCGAGADYNGDGKPDLAVNTPTGVSILLGTGKPLPAFKYGATIAQSGAGCLVTGDLNNDGVPDLLVPSNGTVVAYLGNGDGTFTQASVTATPTGGYLALGDFNHDGKLDFATSGNLLAYGNGDGTFQKPVPISPSLPNGLADIAAGDVNGDGWPDLVFTSSYPTSEIYILLNNQHGGFTVSSFNAVDSSGFNIYPTQVVLAQLAGKGKLNMLVAGIYGGMYLYRGDGKGRFTYDELLDGGAPIVVSDINGDGIPDILSGGPSTLIYLGKGDGSFQAPTFYVGAGPAPGDLVLENLHGQPAGLPDMVLPDLTGGVTVLINTSNRVQ